MPGTTTTVAVTQSQTGCGPFTYATVSGPALPPLAQPTASHPLTILEIGDSLGEDLGIGMADVSAYNSPLVRVYAKAVGDTGLERPDYYNWPANLAAELSQYHPEAVVIFLGGNDGQNPTYADGSGVGVQFGTPQWQEVYSQRVAQMITEATSAGARVLWVGMPVMASCGFSQEMQQLNAVFTAEVAAHAGATYFPSWNVFTDAAGFYSAVLPQNGEMQLMRDYDGVHLAGAGCIRIATAILPVMENAWGINLGS